MIPAYLNSISLLLDTQSPIDQLSFLQNDPDKLKKYIAEGLRFHYRTTKSSSEMAYWVLQDFIEEHPNERDLIDYVIFTCDNLDESNEINVVTINAVLNELHLTTAIPIFQGHSNCANICTSFVSGAALVESGRANNVLVVSIDKIGEDDDQFMMHPEISILSDAGICLWISSKQITHSLEIGQTFSKNNPSQWLIDKRENFQLYTTNKLKLYLNVSRQLKKSLHETMNHFIMNNYYKSINDMFLNVMNIPLSMVDASNLSTIGHAPAGDVFINLCMLLNEGKINFGEVVVLFADSPSLCIGIVLKKING